MNLIYPKYKEAARGGGANVDLLTGDVKAILVDLADYTYAATDEFLSDVPAAARVAISGNMTTKTVTDGIFSCDDFTWTAVSGDIVEAVIFYIDTGVEGTSRLFCLLDTDQDGLPYTPDASDVPFEVAPEGIAG